MNDLYHHGIKGQQWGIQNGPPYPLDSRGKASFRKYNLKKYTSPNRELVKSSIKASAKQTVAMLIPGLALVMNAKTINDLRKQHLDWTNYMKKEGAPEKLNQLRKKNLNTSIEEDLKECNPRIGKQAGKINNCVNCTMSMEMRRRGYDVVARSTSHGVTIEQYGKAFKDVNFKILSSERGKKESRKEYVKRSYDVLCNLIEKFGDDSRGYVTLSYEDFGSGHALYWEVKNGSVKFYDGQSGNTNTDRVFSLADYKTLSFARLDNLKVTDEIGNYVVSKNRKKE